MGFLSSIAKIALPAAGTIIGGSVGGPIGAAVGGGIGSSLAGEFGEDQYGYSPVASPTSVGFPTGADSRGQPQFETTIKPEQGTKAGQWADKYYDAAFPDTTQWERLGTVTPMGQVHASENQAKAGMLQARMNTEGQLRATEMNVNAQMRNKSLEVQGSIERQRIASNAAMMSSAIQADASIKNTNTKASSDQAVAHTKAAPEHRKIGPMERSSRAAEEAAKAATSTAVSRAREVVIKDKMADVAARRVTVDELNAASNPVTAGLKRAGREILLATQGDVEASAKAISDQVNKSGDGSFNRAVREWLGGLWNSMKEGAPKVEDLEKRRTREPPVKSLPPEPGPMP